MVRDPDIKVFLRYCGAYLDINGLGATWDEEFAAAFHRIRDADVKASFKRGFAKALLGELTAHEYERATRWDFDTDVEFRAHLGRFWNLLYPNCRPEDATSR